MVLVWVVMLVWMPADALRGDVLRFWEIAHAGGRPYVDFPVEYPPLETFVVVLVGRGSVTAIAYKLAIINGASTMACWWLLRRHWSVNVSTLFLWFAFPLQVFMPFRIDALVLVAVIGAVVLADRDRELVAGVLLAASILFKFWPIVILPVFAIRAQWRTVLLAVATCVTGAAVWVGVSSADAVHQVVSYRDATGWQVESVFGIVVNAVSDAQPRIEAGASRIGLMTPWEVTTARLLTLLLLSAAWILAIKRRSDPMGAPSLAALASLILLSPVASPQYVVWLLPFAAITAAHRRESDVRILMIGAGVFASAVFSVYWGFRDLFVLQVIAAGRALCLLGLVAVGFAESYRGGIPETVAGAG
jgi:hypothetical protein